MREEEPRADCRSALYRSLLEIPVILLVSFVLVFGFVRPVIASPYKIPTESMVPTIEVQDRVLVNNSPTTSKAPSAGISSFSRTSKARRRPW